jgi:hypothetical protein
MIHVESLMKAFRKFKHLLYYRQLIQNMDIACFSILYNTKKKSVIAFVKYNMKIVTKTSLLSDTG